MAAEGELLQRERGDGEQDADADRQGEEGQQVGRVEQAEGDGERQRQVAEELDQRAEQLEHREVRERGEPDRPVAGLASITRWRHSASASPRCQRRRWRERVRSVSGTSVQQTGSGTNPIR